MFIFRSDSSLVEMPECGLASSREGCVYVHNWWQYSQTLAMHPNARMQRCTFFLLGFRLGRKIFGGYRNCHLCIDDRQHEFASIPSRTPPVVPCLNSLSPFLSVSASIQVWISCAAPGAFPTPFLIWTSTPLPDFPLHCSLASLLALLCIVHGYFRRPLRCV